MPIQVTCPGCLTKFTVGDQHAGKTGACPKCKGQITIPSKEDEVVIHAPEFGGEAGAVDSKGRSTLKPIARKEAKFQLNSALIIGGVALLALGIAFLCRVSLTEDQQTYALLAGAILLGPPLAYSGYSFLRDDEELEPYAGGELIIRCLACGAAFALAWAAYWYLGYQVFGDDYSDGKLEIFEVGILCAVAAGIGTFASFVSFDLEPLNGFFHFVLYFAVCVLLRAIMGVPLLPGFGGG
ncbi:MAG: hypothetical protein CMJ58_05815 [Planctomycetaceae bacterium]|nr:hypothetical protein [Planctomycetaceae bacterium]